MLKHLTNTQISQYNASGFISPIAVLTKTEVNSCISEIELFEAETGKQIDFPYKSRSHQIFSWADRDF